MQTRVMDESQRAHGFTTLQMKAAPALALYIWPVSGSLDYARDLARHLGRSDLEIVGGSVLDQRGERLRGRYFSAIVIDHAAEPSPEEYEVLREIRARCVRMTAEANS